MTTAPLITVDCWKVDPSGLPADLTTLWDTAEQPQRVSAALQAVGALRVLTGGAVEPCVNVVRPVGPPAGDSTWAVYPVAGLHSGWVRPSLRSGQWINTSGGGGSVPKLRLPGATRVLRVKVDGVELAPSDYRLYQDGTLLRADGSAWPCAQNLGLADDMPGTFSVAYLTQVPGLAGEQAAGRLAVEFLRAIQGGACQLPDTVTQVARAGVTVTMTPGVFPEGLTGIHEVDTWVLMVNPGRLPAQSAVLSPDRAPHPRETAPFTGPWAPDTDIDVDGGTP